MSEQAKGEKLLLLEREVERFIVSFYHTLDSPNYRDLANVIAPDGVWHRQGKALKGPAMAREAMDQREPGARTRHIVTNLLIDEVTETTASARYYMFAFRADGDPGRPKPDPIALPRALVLMTVKLVKSGDRWLVALMEGDTTFKS